jgi:hypothetical protein
MAVLGARQVSGKEEASMTMTAGKDSTYTVCGKRSNRLGKIIVSGDEVHNKTNTRD